MISQAIPPQRRAVHGPVQLIYSNQESPSTSGEAASPMVDHDFGTVIEALRYARLRLDDPDFSQPSVWDKDSLVLESDAIQMYADDPVLLAVHLAGMTWRDLRSGAVELRHLSMPNLQNRQAVFPSLRVALLSLSAAREEGAWIVDQAGLRPIMSPQTLTTVLDYLQ